MTTKLFSACFNWGIHKGWNADFIKPFQLPADIGEISYVSLGSHHSGIINKSGELYTYGKNKCNNLTHPTTDTPTKVSLPEISQVQCGDSFTVALTKKGEVYTWGSSGSNNLLSRLFGKRNSLGIETSSDILTPTLIDIPEEIFEIACGEEHCLALGKFNLYSWGINECGAVGRGDMLKSYNKPKVLSFFNQADQHIVKIFAGGNTSGVITNKGKAYLWGSNDGMKLGLNHDDLYEKNPFLLSLTNVYDIKDMYIGSKSIMILTETNEIFVAGLGLWKKFMKFTVPDDIEPLQVCCGEDYFAVIGKNGKVAYYGGYFGPTFETEDIPEAVNIMDSKFVPGTVTRIEGKYRYMAGITTIEV